MVLLLQILQPKVVAVEVLVMQVNQLLQALQVAVEMVSPLQLLVLL
jgi:hypothetical protein